MTFGGLAAAGLVLAFAFMLHNAQHSARSGLEQRFNDRALFSAALTESLLTTSFDPAALRLQQVVTAQAPDRAGLDQLRSTGKLEFVEILEDDGRPVATSSGAPPRSSASWVTDAVGRVRRGAVVSLSDLHSPLGRPQLLAVAVPIATAGGQRILVRALPAARTRAFLTFYLGRILGLRQSRAYVIDGHGGVVSGRGVLSPGLFAALRRAPHGTVDDVAYTSHAVTGTPWRVVVTTRRASLYAAVEGTQRWLPWLLVGAFGLVAAIALILMGRASNAGRRLRTTEAHHREVLGRLPDTVVGLFDRDLRCVLLEGAFARESATLWGDIRGRPLADAMPAAHVAQLSPAFAAALNGVEQSFEWKPTGFELTLAVDLLPRRDARGAVNGVLAVARDVTEQRHLEDKLQHLAQHDALTGVPNRRLLLDHAARAFARASRSGGRAGVVSIDLDGFKRVNDDHGHLVGDEALRQAAQRLVAVARTGDLLARVGGDEFVLLIPDLGTDGPEQARERLARVLDRLERTLSEPVDADGISILLGASAGTSIYPDDGIELSTLLHCADAELYRAKDGGRPRQPDVELT